MNAVVEHNPKPEKSAYEQLPRRYRRFVDEYVAGGQTATEALKAAGIGRESRHVRKVASRLIRKPEVAQAIQERTAEVVADMGVRHERVIREMYWLATCDPRKLVDGEGVQIPLHQLPADIAACISAVEIENISYNDETGTRYKYKFWDKNKALDKLGQYLKLWEARQTNVNVDARSVTVNAGDPSAQAALRAVAEIGERIAGLIASPGVSPSGQDGSVLPASVCDGAEGRGASLADSQDKGGAEQP